MTNDKIKFSAKIDSINLSYSKMNQIGNELNLYVPDSAPTLNGTIYFPGGHEMGLSQALTLEETEELNRIINRVVNRSLDKFLKAIGKPV